MTPIFKGLFCALAFSAGTLFAASYDELDAFPQDAGAGQVLYNNTFDAPSDVPASLPPGYAFAPGAGRNGTGAFTFGRSVDKGYQLCPFPVPTLNPLQTYEAEVYVRSKDIRRVGDDWNIGGICVEYFRKGQGLQTKAYHSGYYYKLKSIDESWHKLVLPITAKPEFEVGVNLYLRKGFTGQLWFDDLVIRTTGTSHSIVLNEPKALALDAEKPSLVFSTSKGIPEEAVLLVKLELADKTVRTLTVNGQNSVYRCTTSSLPSGPVRITVSAVDSRRRMKLYTEAFALTALDSSANQAPAHACIIRPDGRAFVDGKPFMPIGIYGYPLDSDLRMLSRAGFNSLISYGSLQMNGGKKTGDLIADLRAGLDVFQRNNMKCIFSVKDQYAHKSYAMKHYGEAKTPAEVAALVARGIKDHPALLCWYINDEEQRQHVPRVARLREAISAVDPWHPTWTLTYRTGDFPYYGISGDIMGTDMYMLDKGKVQNLAQVVDGMKAAASTGQAVWIVPQIFNWEGMRTKDPKKFAAGHFPSEGEIRAHAMIGAILGAKGFVFYSLSDIRNKAEQILPGSFQREWPKVLASVKLLNALEPYIMSARPIRPLKVRQTGKSGQVLAACLTADSGRQAVIIIAVHSQASGDVTLPDGAVFHYAPGAVDANIIF